MHPGLTHEPARLGRRAVARLVELALAAVLYAAVALVAVQLGRTGSGPLALGVVVAAVLVHLVATVGCLLARAALPGQLILGLEHVDPDDGQRAGRRALLKYVVEGAVTAITFGAAVIVVAFTVRPPDHRSWFDKVAGVALVDLRRPRTGISGRTTPGARWAPSP
ncbi:hypothetical protein DDE18_00885 [Nocardioides gansuensis]|uniref:RDD domain-containing protein n=1 Tax=Nocardioides gansuensis TaxID=2138300 RepID=A0A2T8FEU3_9ACTN|nr:RDD family protein [Nocardioides gansuensis]PVG84226.1 hypothetical protein DDE18_00885 [Nocardioides gansuensis]